MKYSIQNIYLLLDFLFFVLGFPPSWSFHSCFQNSMPCARDILAFLLEAHSKQDIMLSSGSSSHHSGSARRKHRNATGRKLSPWRDRERGAKLIYTPTKKSKFSSASSSPSFLASSSSASKTRPISKQLVSQFIKVTTAAPSTIPQQVELGPAVQPESRGPGPDYGTPVKPRQPLAGGSRGGRNLFAPSSVVGGSRLSPRLQTALQRSPQTTPVKHLVRWQRPSPHMATAPSETVSTPITTIGSILTPADSERVSQRISHISNQLDEPDLPPPIQANAVRGCSKDVVSARTLFPSDPGPKQTEEKTHGRPFQIALAASPTPMQVRAAARRRQLQCTTLSIPRWEPMLSVIALQLGVLMPLSLVGLPIYGAMLMKRLYHVLHKKGFRFLVTSLLTWSRETSVLGVVYVLRFLLKLRDVLTSTKISGLLLTMSVVCIARCRFISRSKGKHGSSDSNSIIK